MLSVYYLYTVINNLYIIKLINFIIYYTTLVTFKFQRYFKIFNCDDFILILLLFKMEFIHDNGRRYLLANKYNYNFSVGP